MTQSTSEKVSEIIDIQDAIMVTEFKIEELTAANINLMEKQILEIPENPETKEQYDNARCFNIDAKKLLPLIEERRKELKSPILKKGKAIDDTAKRAKAMIQPLIEMSGSRRKAWESKKEAEKAEKERQEAERMASIQARFDMLTHLAAKPLEYNRSSEDIARDIANIEAFEIRAIDFQERQGDAEILKSKALETANTALENRKKFEADQAESTRVKAEQEAERKRLDEERNKIAAERKEQEEAIKKTAEAEKNRLEAEKNKLEVERNLLEAKKEAAAHAAIVAEREVGWELAHQENLDLNHSAALVEHEQYKADLQTEMDQARTDAMSRWEQTEQAKAATAERIKQLGPDKLIMHAIATSIDSVVCGVDIPILNTDEANSLVRDLISSIKYRIFIFEKDVKEL